MNIMAFSRLRDMDFLEKDEIVGGKFFLRAVPADKSVSNLCGESLGRWCYTLWIDRCHMFIVLIQDKTQILIRDKGQVRF